MPAALPEVTVHVIVPARNEEDCLGRCLDSLVSQQGISFRITVVDDGSTDRTRALAESFPGVQVISASEPASGVMGKCNALIIGAHGSTAKWLLFTDADTVHYPGSLAAAVREAEERRVDLLSYSPEQAVATFAERILMPLVFADLVRTYPPERVNDPRDPAVAANGQYILVRREVYEGLGGHACVANKLLEDVELARTFKVSDHKIWFRFGNGLVRTRMYRSFSAMWEGWTKNLALLFRHPVALAAWRSLEFLAIMLPLIIALAGLANDDPFVGWVGLAVAVFFYLIFLARVRKAHFPWSANLLSFLGLPLFVSLLVRSYIHSHRRGEVTWKGRTYRQSAPQTGADSSTPKGQADRKS
jgi:glycosyltransferase involved in cell wall biosynthesis